MNIRRYIEAKKAQFQARKDKKLSSQAQQAEVRLYRAEIETAQRQKIRDAEIAEGQAKSLRPPSMFDRMNTARGTVGGSLKGTAKKVRAQNASGPTLFGNPNSSIGSDYRGPDFSSPVSRPLDFGAPKGKGVTAKKKGYDPFGYRGL